MRVGRLVRMVPDRHFGFIQADEFREDVFFHFSAVVQGEHAEDWEQGQELEFELNELLRMSEQRLQASQVKRATRPLVHSLDNVRDFRSKAKHHPRALQKKPNWKPNRRRESEETDQSQ